MQAAKKVQAMQPDCPHWTFGKYVVVTITLILLNIFDSLHRQANGKFKDDDLANILHNA